MEAEVIQLIGAAALAASLAACSSAATHHAAAKAAATANAVASVEAAASACTSSGGTWDGSSCQTPQTDPNGQQCAALDSLGYCPGDDPSPMQQWCNGDGYSKYQQVQQDLNQLQTDSGNNDLAAVEQDGTSLFQDAHTAGLNLPPLSNAHKVDYGVWMGYLLVAGYKSSQGDINGAVSALAAASKFTSISTYVNNQCGSTA